MQNRDILYSVLIATALALNPLNATPITTFTKQQSNRLSTTVAQTLYARGLDEEAAQKISEEFFAQGDELFSFMLTNLVHGCSVLSEAEIMEYISTLALKRASIHLNSYASLVSMVQNIQHTTVSKETLAELQNIATKNSLFIA